MKAKKRNPFKTFPHGLNSISILWLLRPDVSFPKIYSEFQIIRDSFEAFSPLYRIGKSQNDIRKLLNAETHFAKQGANQKGYSFKEIHRNGNGSIYEQGPCIH
jgi:hypothetical protein